MEITTDNLVSRCREAGLKATPQRVAVLRAVSTRLDHPSAELVLRLAREELPTLSIATVYKALDALTGAGLLEQVSRFDTKRYDANLEPHHHLICERCGGVTDLHAPELAPALPGHIEGFYAREARLQILGICAACAHPQTGVNNG